MRGLVLVLAAVALTACGMPAQLTPSARNQVAIVENAHEDRLVLLTTMRLPRGQVLVPVRADAREEFCTFGRVIFASGTPQGRTCFFDRDNAGRFTEAFQNITTRAFRGLPVNVPYRLEEFPCENCAPSQDADIRPLTDTRMLAAHSIAPRALQGFVAMALERDPGLTAAITAAHPTDTANAQRIVDIAAREIVQRQAIARCTNTFSPVAAALVPFGQWVAMAAMNEEEQCVEEFMRTGQMPPFPRPTNREIETPQR